MLASSPSKALRSRAPLPVLRLLHYLLILRLCFSGELYAQVSASPAVGSLQTSGEVYLNGNPAADEQTVFGGEDIRTGLNGVAALSIPGTGVFNVASQTEISLRTGRSLVALKHGTVAVRSFQSGRSLEIEFGNFVVHLPVGNEAAAAAAAVTVSPDGAAEVECLDGVVRVSRLQATESVDLHLGQSVKIDAKSRLQAVESASLAATESSDQASRSRGPAPRRSQTAYIALGAAAAGGITAAAVALSHKSSQPISPSAH